MCQTVVTCNFCCVAYFLPPLVWFLGKYFLHSLCFWWNISYALVMVNPSITFPSGSCLRLMCTCKEEHCFLSTDYQTRMVWSCDCKWSSSLATWRRQSITKSKETIMHREEETNRNMNGGKRDYEGEDLKLWIQLCLKTSFLAFLVKWADSFFLLLSSFGCSHLVVGLTNANYVPMSNKHSFLLMVHTEEHLLYG